MAVINMLTIPFGAMFYERKVPHHCSLCGNKMRLYSTKDLFPLNDSMLIYTKHSVVCVGCKIKSDWRDLSRSKNRKESIKRMTENMIAFDGTEVFYKCQEI